MENLNLSSIKNKAMDIIKNFRTFLVMFMSSSTIHGLNHIAAPRRHFLERFIWASLIAAGLYSASILSGLTLTRYFENPTVMSMERDKFSWNTSFPAATLCPSTKVDDQLLEEYIEKSTVKNKTALEAFILSLVEAGYDNFEHVIDYPEVHPNDYMDLILNISFKFHPTLTNSGVNGQKYELLQIVNEFGVCYSFNSHLAIYSSRRYWKENTWKLMPENETFFVNPLDGEVFANIVNMSTGYKLFIHGPYEVADISTKQIISPDGYFLQVYLTALSIISTPRTRGLQINQRKCRFHYESNLRHSPVYSYVLCRMECRLQLARKLCGCIPHFYRKLDNDRVCDVKGLHCLAQHKERLTAMKKECACSTNCDEVNYIVQHFDLREWFLGSNLQWGLKEYPRMRVKRDVIFGFADVLVYVGGMTGLFFGCSVLSFAEIFYFFTLRLYAFFKQKRNEHTAVIVISKPEIQPLADFSHQRRSPYLHISLSSISTIKY